MSPIHAECSAKLSESVIHAEGIRIILRHVAEPRSCPDHEVRRGWGGGVPHEDARQPRINLLWQLTPMGRGAYLGPSCTVLPCGDLDEVRGRSEFGARPVGDLRPSRQSVEIPGRMKKSDILFEAIRHETS